MQYVQSYLFWNPPQFNGLILGTSHHEPVIERGEGKVGHHLAVTVHTGNGRLVGATARGQREDSNAGT